MSLLRLDKGAVLKMESRFETLGDVQYLREKPGAPAYRLRPGEAQGLQDDWHRRTAFARAFLPFSAFGGLPTLLLLMWLGRALGADRVLTLGPTLSGMVLAFAMFGLPLVGLALHYVHLRRADRLMLAAVARRPQTPAPAAAGQGRLGTLDRIGATLLGALVLLEFYHAFDSDALLGRGPMGVVTNIVRVLAALCLAAMLLRRRRRRAA